MSDHKIFNDYRPKTKTVNLMLLDGGVGDHVASLIAVNYIIHKHPWLTPIVWMPDFLVDFSKHLLKKTDNMFGYSDMRHSYNPNYPTKTTKWDGYTSPMKIPLVDYAFLKLCDENPDNQYKNYLTIDPTIIDTSKFSLPREYVVITTGYTADVREFPPNEVNKIADYLVSLGIAPLFLGSTSTKTGGAHTIKGSFKEEVDFSKGIDLIDTTNLLEAAKIMSQAKAVLGVDNGLLHVAACTDVPIIAGFTTVHPNARTPIRHNKRGYNYFPVTPDTSLECKFCQSNTNFLYSHDYRNCLFKGKNLAKTNLCTKQMTAEKFISILDIILIS